MNLFIVKILQQLGGHKIKKRKNREEMAEQTGVKQARY